MKGIEPRWIVPVLSLLLLVCSCGESEVSSKKDSNSDERKLTPTEQIELTQKINHMADRDQVYRSIISLGTMDSALVAKDRSLRDTASIEEYIAFTRTVEKTLTPRQTDSLWVLQYALDLQNYEELKAIIETFGYPSEERLNTDEDRAFAILLHPPREVSPETYLTEMKKLLLPEVTAGRMNARSYAMFVDNIRSKILKLPQLYGTGKSFNSSTMKMGPPIIEDIVETNKERAAIGLPPLEEGDYALAEK